MTNKYTVNQRKLHRVLIDFDGTICHSIWPELGIGDPKPGVKEALESLRVKGWKIHIYTSRPSADEINVATWLKDHYIPYDNIFMGKPLAELYIDDRGYHFVEWARDLPRISQRLKDSTKNA